MIFTKKCVLVRLCCVNAATTSQGALSLDTFIFVLDIPCTMYIIIIIESILSFDFVSFLLNYFIGLCSKYCVYSLTCLGVIFGFQ